MNAISRLLSGARINPMPTAEMKSTPPTPSLPHLGRLALIVLGVWLFLGTFMAAQFQLNSWATGRPISPRTAIEISIPKYLVYAILTFPVIWLTRRFPPNSKRWPVSLSAHLFGAIVFLILFVGIRMLSGTATDRVTLQKLPISMDTAISLARSNLFELFTMYSTIAIVALTIQLYRQFKEREIREAELKQKMAEYELQVLKLQLHPHFLFNAMNGISTLMNRDVKTAQDMLVRLSELLRMALSHSAANEVTLREEIEFVKAYLEIEQMRFGERLRIDFQIDSATLEARVPNMIIQPLVENAIQYGIAQVKGGGMIMLTTGRQNGRVHIRIINDGPSSPGPHPMKGSGIGLGNTRSRLGHLYGESYRLRIVGRAEGGAELDLEIPYRGATVNLELEA
jgi:two-component system, LytTR family, sensor kinase